ncbi:MULTISPECIES: DUF4760 domain-containing protein [unclassified Pseudomonas]|uniref:DUF4760 domain-containing protein n=1 Tax=unclassified Pseudomonas TaxID=196821 RepID=UPI00111C3F0B|nr:MULTISPECIES: DUF4760 domain-containing protein [unclassified Pseudomonas]
MNKFWIGAGATAFVLGILARIVLSYGFQHPLPFPIDLVDAFIVLTGALVAVLTVHQFIRSKYPDTNEMLPLFSGVIWTVIVSSYVILRYEPTYQTSLSILVTGVFVGMGWWIQAITTAANARRTHTLNIIMASRTSTEYQDQTRASSKLYRSGVVCSELAEWRFSPNRDEFKNTIVPDDINDAINGTVYVLNYFEFLAQGIKFRDLDDCLLRECFSGILAGIERRGFHIIIEAQKSEPKCFEGVIRLTKDWNGESYVEKYRANPDNAAVGVRYPSGAELKAILNAKCVDQSEETIAKAPDAANDAPTAAGTGSLQR